MGADTWYVVADSARARIVAFDPYIEPGGIHPAAPELIEELHEAIPRGRDIVTDRPGRTFDRMGSHRHATEPSSDPRRVAKRRFADRVAEKVTEALDQGRCSAFVLVAPPGFLGDLRRALPGRVLNTVEKVIPKDLTTLDLFSLEERVGPAAR